MQQKGNVEWKVAVIRAMTRLGFECLQRDGAFGNRHLPVVVICQND